MRMRKSLPWIASRVPSYRVRTMVASVAIALERAASFLDFGLGIHFSSNDSSKPIEPGNMGHPQPFCVATTVKLNGHAEGGYLLDGCWYSKLEQQSDLPASADLMPVLTESRPDE